MSIITSAKSILIEHIISTATSKRRMKLTEMGQNMLLLLIPFFYFTSPNNFVHTCGGREQNATIFML